MLKHIHLKVTFKNLRDHGLLISTKDNTKKEVISLIPIAVLKF